MSFVASATSFNSNAVTFPSSVLADDLLIYFDVAQVSSGTPTDVVPTGFTGINTVALANAFRARASLKRAAGTEASASITGMAVGDVVSVKGALVFRPNGTLATGYTASGAQQQATTGDPTAQVISINAAAVPLIAFAAAIWDDFTLTSFSWTPGSPSSLSLSVAARVRYLIVNSAPANQTVDETDTENYTGLMSWYITAS